MPKEGGLYKNKYKIDSTRLKYWDYTNSGYYFVTICIKNKTKWFGNIIKGEMILNNIGKIVDEQIKYTEKLRPNVFLDTWIVMPNHVHAIIVLENKKDVEETDERIRDEAWDKNCRDEARLVSTTNKRISPKPNSLSAIVGGLKSACTKRIHEIGYQNFEWQERFYDRIIRDDYALNDIRKYIQDNPIKWYIKHKNV